ncbi:MAG: hypothetical protein IKM97_01825 [Clostridia bacterium]|nr:hypothetical protein [Clostridia bacterium]
MFSEDFTKDSNIVDKTEEEHKEDLFKDIETSKMNLNNLYENLKFAER